MGKRRRRDDGWETFVARDVVARSTPVPHDPQRQSARALAGLSEGGYGAVNIGIHHPGEFGVLESWSGYVRADDLGSIFGHRRPLLQCNTPLDTVARAAPMLRRRAHLVLVLHRHRRPLRARRTPLRAASSRTLGIRHRFFLVRGGHNWALWRGNAARAYLAASRRVRAA